MNVATPTQIPDDGPATAGADDMPRPSESVLAAAVEASYILELLGR